MEYSKLLLHAQKADEKLNLIVGYQANHLQYNLQRLLSTGEVEVGYRQSCGTTDKTHKVFREWLKMLKTIKKSGIEVTELPVKHKNGYATLAGGFWSSTIYRIQATNNSLSTL